jgi:hypothetical protein
LNAIQKNWKYLAIGGGGLLFIIIVIAALASPGPDISGRYELLIAGQHKDTVVEIKSADGTYEIQFLENDTVRSKYILPKPRGGRFAIESMVDGKPGNRFNLEVVDGGLRGTVDIPSLAKGIDVFFRKVQ